MTTRRALAGVAVAVALAAGACGGSAGNGRPDGVGTQAPAAGTTTAPHGTPARRRDTRPRAPAPHAGGALAALDRLPVKGRAPMTGYSRERFGDGWLAVNGCDERDRILRRDLRRKTFLPGTARCEVLTGTLADPYAATTVGFARGGAPDVEIDHVVALGDAWQKGAQQWSPARRVAFANDPLNLLSVDAALNRQKGDGDAATWLPPNKAFRCDYVARQIAVKRKYGAWVTAAEREAMRRVLGRCPGERLPARGRLHLPRLLAPTPASPSGAPVYASCDAVRAAGAAPLRRGTAAYAANRRLDGDGDGLACE